MQVPLDTLSAELEAHLEGLKLKVTAAAGAHLSSCQGTRPFPLFPFPSARAPDRVLFPLSLFTSRVCLCRRGWQSATGQPARDGSSAAAQLMTAASGERGGGGGRSWWR